MVNLKEKRTAAGMTQDQLAEAVGVVRQTISNVEVGMSQPSLTNAQAIAQVLNGRLPEEARFAWAEFYE